MKVAPLFNEAAAQEGANLEVIVEHTDLTIATADTGQTLSPFTVKAGESIELIRSDLRVPFEDTTDAASVTTAITVGDAGSANRLMTSTELNRNGTEVYTKAGTGTIYAPTSDTVVTITVAVPTSGKNIAALNKGRVRLLFRHTRPRAL